MWKHIVWGNGRCCSRIVVHNRGCPKKCLCEIICDFIIIKLRNLLHGSFLLVVIITCKYTSTIE